METYLQEVGDHDGLEDVELEVAVGTSNGNSNVVAHHLRAHHRQGLALRGVHLACNSSDVALTTRRTSEQ